MNTNECRLLAALERVTKRLIHHTASTESADLEAGDEMALEQANMAIGKAKRITKSASTAHGHHPRIIIEVNGGVADVRCADSPMLVILADWDNIKQGDDVYTQDVEPVAPAYFDRTYNRIMREAKAEQTRPATASHTPHGNAIAALEAQAAQPARAAATPESDGDK